MRLAGNMRTGELEAVCSWVWFVGEALGTGAALKATQGLLDGFLSHLPHK